MAGSSVSVPANISSRLSVRTVLVAQCEARGRSSPRSFRPSRRPVFVEAVSSTRCSLQAGTDTWDGEAPLDGRATVPTQSLRVPGSPSHC